MGGHFAELLLHAAKAALSRSLQFFGDFLADHIDPLRQRRSQVFQPAVNTGGAAAIDRVHSLIKMSKGLAKADKGVSGAGLGVAQPRIDPVDDFFDQSGGGRIILGADLLQAALHHRDGLASAALALMQVTGDLAERGFQRTQGLG